MKRYTRTMGILALLLVAATPMANAQASGKVGTLTLYGGKGETDPNKCQIPMNNGRVVMGDGYDCYNDTYYHFKISLGQPGTIVTFHDSPRCNASEPAHRYLITGGEDDDLNMTALQALAHDGSTYRLVQNNLETFGSPKRGRLYGKLSCVSFSQY